MVDKPVNTFLPGVAHKFEYSPDFRSAGAPTGRGDTDQVSFLMRQRGAEGPILSAFSFARPENRNAGVSPAVAGASRSRARAGPILSATKERPLHSGQAGRAASIHRSALSTVSGYPPADAHKQLLCIPVPAV